MRHPQPAASAAKRASSRAIVVGGWPKHGCPVHDSLIVMSGGESTTHPQPLHLKHPPRSWTNYVHERGTQLLSQK
jgi:hypothetical protein